MERKKKEKVESEFFTLEKKQGENSNLQISRVIFMGVVGVDVTVVLVFPGNGVRGNALSLPERERLDMGKNFPATWAWDPDGEESIWLWCLHP